MEGKIVYRLKRGNPGSWQLGMSSMKMLKKVTVDGEEIQINSPVGHYPGATSPFVDDNEKRNFRKKNIWFFDQGNGFTEYHADPNDVILNKILRNHKGFNVDYIMFDPNEEARAKFARQQKKEEIRGTIMNSNDADAKGMGFAVFGYTSFGWLPVRCKTEMLDIVDRPDQEGLENGVDFMTRKLGAADYSAKLLAGAGYHLKYIEEDMHSNNVVWSDTGEIIIPLGLGEIGVEKLAQFLSYKTDDSYKAIQRLGERINAPKKDRAQAYVPTVDLELLQERYKIKFGNEVPARFKNDPKWIGEKLAAEDAE